MNERIGVSTKATPKRRELVRYFDKSVSNAFIEDPEERYENALLPEEQRLKSSTHYLSLEKISFVEAGSREQQQPGVQSKNERELFEEYMQGRVRVEYDKQTYVNKEEFEKLRVLQGRLFKTPRDVRLWLAYPRAKQ